MESFSEIISRLLLRHNCVIIPDFGGFVARTVPAEIDEETGSIYPAKKSILFNAQLLTSDGLLISEYALSNGISYTESQLKIQEIVSLWNNELNEGNRISINKIGELFITENGKLNFEQDRFFNLLLSSYGLRNVKFAPIRKIKEPVVLNSNEAGTLPIKKSILELAEDQVDISIIEHPAKVHYKKRWRVALAAACLLPLAFYSFWIPTNTNVLESGVISKDDFNPFKQNELPIYSQKSISSGVPIFSEKSLEEQLKDVDPSASSFSYEFDDTLYLMIPLHRKLEEKTVTELQESNQVMSSTLSEVSQNSNQASNNVSNQEKLPFSGVKPGVKYAIVGCFSQIENAKKYVSELNLKGFNAKFLDVKNGLYRISIDESPTIDSLQSTIQKASTQGYNTWILK